MKFLSVVLVVLISFTLVFAQSEYFHKRGTEYDSTIPSPESLTGIKPGVRHLTHLEIEDYFMKLSQSSNRTELFRFGESYEGRGLYLLAISSEKNIKEIQKIRQENLDLIQAGFKSQSAAGIIQNNPVFVWLAAAVHGDETSSPDAVVEIAYQLSASNAEHILSILNNTIILIDPLQNPDGRQRTVEYYSHMGSIRRDTYPQAQEHQIHWPYGRGNHYLFDMNRDWFPLTQRESVARVQIYQRWMPQVFVDLHEMGHNSGYYFSPPADPVNEYIPDITRKWWQVFGKANAQAFDKNGWQYWSREIFDQFYPGYGESWPTFYGAIGMTYEQASSEGQAVKRKDGEILTYIHSVWQHFTASFSTIQTASGNKAELLQYFYDYYQSVAQKYKNDKIKSVVINSEKYPAEVIQMAEKLQIMGVNVYQSESAFEIKGLSPFIEKSKKISLAKNSVIIPFNQISGYLARAMLDYRQELPKDFEQAEKKTF